MYGLGSLGRIILLLSVAFILYVVGQIIYNIFFHPLRHYPGPLSWGATRLTWVRALHTGYLHHDLSALHDKYGPIVRVAPDELSYIDARAWKDIYVGGAARPGHPPIERNGVWFRKRTSTEPYSIMGNHEDAHARFRRAFAAAFTDKAVGEQAPLVERYVDMMMHKFHDMVTKGSDGAVVNIVSWLNSLTFDISGDLSFGESFGSIEKGEPHPWVEISCSFGKGLALVASLNYYAPLQKLLIVVMPIKLLKKMIYHRKLSIEKVRQRMQLQHERPDYVQAVLNYNNEKTEKMTSDELELNMAVIVFAASDTTSTALASALFHLLNAPKVMARLVEELRTAFAREEDINIAGVTRLEYLTAVINEALRLGPPSAVTVPRIVTSDTEEICGQRVPRGTYVSVNQHTAFRSATNFTRPNQFMPERFLPQETSTPDDNMAAFNPFLLGRHMCIGQKFAWAEMRLVLARLLYAFDLSWAADPKFQDWGEQQTFIFWQKNPLLVRMKRR